MELREAQQRKKVTDSPESFQKQFLDFVKGHDIEVSLYKADENFGGWSNISLDTNSSNGITQENCS